MSSVATMQSIGWALTDLRFICLWTAGTGSVKSVIAACSPAMLVSDCAFWWWCLLLLVGFDGLHVGGFLFTPKHICQHASSFWACVTQIKVLFFCALACFQCYFLPSTQWFISKLHCTFFFQLKANQFPCFDLCLCAPQLHHIHHSPGSLPKFYAATLRVDISGRGWRGGKKGGKGMCVRKKKRKKKQENHPVNSARSSEVSLHCWWVYGLPGVKRGCAYGSAVVLIRSSCLMWLENKRLSSQINAEHYLP